MNKILALGSAFTLVVSVGAAPSSAPPDQAGLERCATGPNLQEIWSKPSLRWVIVGEVHGTAEIPALFGDIVCEAARIVDRPVVVALELSETEQKSLDTYLASDGSQGARQTFLSAGQWRSEFQDGRTSEAQFELIERLRQMLHLGRIKRVQAFQPASFESPQAYEKAMADRLLAASTDSTTLVIALVGNAHAMRRDIMQRGYKPAAAHLPREGTFTLDVAKNGGSAWNCSPSCGVHQMQPWRAPTSPVLQLMTDEGAPYDGILPIEATTASKPQIAR